MTSLFNRMAEHGLTLRHDREGTQRLPCPMCDKGPRDTALAVTPDHDGAVWLCHRCGFKGALRDRAESVVRPKERPRVARSDHARHETLSDYWRAFWRECKPIAGECVAGRYLASRGCALPPVDGDLRWHSHARHWPTQTSMSAMIGLITDAITCAPLSLHLTFLRPDGTGKAGTERDKLLLPRHRKNGGVIRLWPDEAVTYSLGVAEGIESALSLAHAHSPVWAAIDAGNLAGLPVMAGIETLMIAVDHDDAGIRAAKTCATRWSAAGADVRLVLPERVGADINDARCA